MTDSLLPHRAVETVQGELAMASPWGRSREVQERSLQGVLGMMSKDDFARAFTRWSGALQANCPFESMVV